MKKTIFLYIVIYIIGSIISHAIFKNSIIIYLFNVIFPTTVGVGLLLFRRYKNKKKKIIICYLLFYAKLRKFQIVSVNLTEYYSLSRYSSETVSFFLPFALLAARTLRPLAVDILSRNPCLFFLFLLEG